MGACKLLRVMLGTQKQIEKYAQNDVDSTVIMITHTCQHNLWRAPALLMSHIYRTNHQWLLVSKLLLFPYLGKPYILDPELFHCTRNNVLLTCLVQSSSCPIQFPPTNCRGYINILTHKKKLATWHEYQLVYEIGVSMKQLCSGIREPNPGCSLGPSTQLGKSMIFF